MASRGGQDGERGPCCGHVSCSASCADIARPHQLPLPGCRPSPRLPGPGKSCRKVPRWRKPGVVSLATTAADLTSWPLALSSAHLIALAGFTECLPGSVPPPAQPRPARLSPRPPSRGRPACPLTSSAISAKASRRPYRPMTEVVWWYLQGRAGLVQRPWARPGQQPVHPRLSRARPSDHRAASVPGECSPLGILDSKMEGQLDLGDQGSERG